VLLANDYVGARGSVGDCGEKTGVLILTWTRIRNSDLGAASKAGVHDDNNDEPNNPVISNKREQQKSMLIQGFRRGISLFIVFPNIRVSVPVMTKWIDRFRG
jgi:hypothetical protein